MKKTLCPCEFAFWLIGWWQFTGNALILYQFCFGKNFNSFDHFLYGGLLVAMGFEPFYCISI
jgi:hypothetical protein